MNRKVGLLIVALGLLIVSCSNAVVAKTEAAKIEQIQIVTEVHGIKKMFDSWGYIDDSLVVSFRTNYVVGSTLSLAPDLKQMNLFIPVYLESGRIVGCMEVDKGIVVHMIKFHCWHSIDEFVQYTNQGVIYDSNLIHFEGGE